jgi:two-component system KDP operon response regulator KdpE
VLLDIKLPDIDGYTICRRIRNDSSVPIIMLTGMGTDKEKVQGLDAGADDYLVKPFSVEELLARIRAVLRRSHSNFSSTTPTIDVFSTGNFEMDYVKRQVILAGVEIKLTPTEFYLLQELTLNVGKVLTYSYLLNKVWGPEYGEERQYLHVFIGNLRSKLNLQHNDNIEIETIAGVGYRFKV